MDVAARLAELEHAVVRLESVLAAREAEIARKDKVTLAGRRGRGDGRDRSGRGAKRAAQHLVGVIIHRRVADLAPNGSRR